MKSFHHHHTLNANDSNDNTDNNDNNVNNDSKHSINNINTTNPWSFQQSNAYDTDNDSDHELKQTLAHQLRFRRNSADRRHYSYASSTTIAPESFDFDDNDYDQNHSGEDSVTSNQTSYAESKQHRFAYLAISPPNTETTTVPAEVAETIVSTDPELSELGTNNDTHDTDPSLSNDHSTMINTQQSTTPITTQSVAEEHIHNHVEPSSQLASMTEVAIRSLSDSGFGPEGDVLEHLVQRLQSEVADTRAIVFDLENRLNAAESSNRHIVDELKVLLADAEETLVDSDESDSEQESVAPSSKPGSGSGSEEDSNIVYNRICGALQTLITEAQSALSRTSTAPSVSSSIIPNLDRRRPCRHLMPRLLLQSSAGQQQSSTDSVAEFTDDGECSCSCISHSSPRTSRRSSISHTRPDRDKAGPYQSLSSSAPLPSSSYMTKWQQPRPGRNVYSKMMWREKQSEQYERYRRSCDRVSLELEMLFNDTILDTEEPMDDCLFLSPISTTATSSVPLNSASSIADQDASQPTVPFTGSNLRSTVGADRISSSSHPRSRAERFQRIYQTQLLGPQVRTQQLQFHQQQRQRLGGRTNSYTRSRLSPSSPRSMTISSSHRTLSSSSQSRRFRSQGVGSSRPQSIFMQLYSLWKHTWLRRRMMHVLTESLELMLILWVVLKLSEASLAWMGIQMTKGGPRVWLTYIYGDRESAGASVAKELYEKIKRDGFRLKQSQLQDRREKQVVSNEFATTEAAMKAVGLLPSTPFTPAGMVWAPVGKMLEHAVSGLVLAYLSDYVRRIVKKL